MGGAAWGLYIVFAVYFAGVAFAGITLAALIRLFNIERLKPIVRLAGLLSVGAVILGAISIMVDLGRPIEGITNLFLYARPQSPFFGTFTLVIAGKAARMRRPWRSSQAAFSGSTDSGPQGTWTPQRSRIVADASADGFPSESSS
jgi:hypothetical protein